MRGQNGVEFRQEFNGHGLRHVSVICRNVSITNFASRLAIEVYQGSKWSRISPGIQWTWSQTCDTYPLSVDTCPLLTLLPAELKGTVGGQNVVAFTRNSMDIVPDNLD